MSYPNQYAEIIVKSHQEEMLLMAAEARRAQQAPPRQGRRFYQRPWLWRLRGGLIAFGLRRHARRQHFARRHYAADWRAEVHTIISRDVGE